MQSQEHHLTLTTSTSKVLTVHSTEDSTTHSKPLNRQNNTELTSETKNEWSLKKDCSDCSSKILKLRTAEQNWFLRGVN